MLKCWKLCTCVFLLLLIDCGQTLAEGRLPILQTIGQEPYSFQDENGQFQGYHYLIANRILQEAGYDTTAHPVPLKRLIRDMQQGLSDCGLAANSEFAQDNFEIIENFNHNLKIGIMPRAGIDLNSYDDLRTISIGVPVGFSIGEPFDKDNRLLKVPTLDYNQGVLMLSYKRIDAIVGVLESIEYSAYKIQSDRQLTFGKPLIAGSAQIALICNNKALDSILVAKLKAAAIRLKESGEIDQIIKNFFDEIR